MVPTYQMTSQSIGDTSTKSTKKSTLSPPPGRMAQRPPHLKHTSESTIQKRDFISPYTRIRLLNILNQHIDSMYHGQIIIRTPQKRHFNYLDNSHILDSLTKSTKGFHDQQITKVAKTLSTYITKNKTSTNPGGRLGNTQLRLSAPTPTHGKRKC